MPHIINIDMMRSQWRHSAMRILLLTHSFNSLSQRLYVELCARGHELSVELDINDRVTAQAAQAFQPEIILCPYLKRAIPPSIWTDYVCLIVHPGPPGDRGPHALDWAILRDVPHWGVTVLQANGSLDAGPIWAFELFRMRSARKSALYRREVTEAAVVAVVRSIDRALHRAGALSGTQYADLSATATGWQPAVSKSQRTINWVTDTAPTILRKIYSADGSPGVEDIILNERFRLYDARIAKNVGGPPGALIGCTGSSICRATSDGAILLGQLKPMDRPGYDFKQPALAALGSLGDRLPRIEFLPDESAIRSESGEIRYVERESVGYLHFEFYNGAMSTLQARELLLAYRAARSRPTRVIALMGSADFWSNGMHLHCIEAAESPGQESRDNINAINDLSEDILLTASHLTIAALQGNAAAGGVFLALSADRVLARSTVVLNPHYRNMGNLYGSEHWTYLLPGRIGPVQAQELMNSRLPMGAEGAKALGLVDAIAGPDLHVFNALVETEARRMASDGFFPLALHAKLDRRSRDEEIRPLSLYRAGEMDRMEANFFGFDPSYHIARHRFVHRAPHSRTPLHLAPHRRLGFVPIDRIE